MKLKCVNYKCSENSSSEDNRCKLFDDIHDCMKVKLHFDRRERPRPDYFNPRDVAILGGDPSL